MDNEKTTPETVEDTAAPVEEKKKGRKSGKVAELEKKLADKTDELAAAEDRYQRMLAEYANYKRRTEQEKLQIGLYTKADMLTSLLTSIDNMEKAIAAPAGDDYKVGVDMVLRQFMETLFKMGLEPIGVEGEPFDPNIHNAVMHVDNEELGENTISMVFQKGFKIGEKVVRFAMVQVAN